MSSSNLPTGHVSLGFLIRIGLIDDRAIPDELLVKYWNEPCMGFVQTGPKSRELVSVPDELKEFVKLE